MSIEPRYFKNRFEDYNELSAASVVTDNKIVFTSPVITSVESKWHATINKLQQADTSDNTVYTGTSGIALLKLRRAPDDVNNLKEIKKLLQSLNLRNNRLTFLCGDAGPVAISAVVCHKLGELDQMAMHIKQLIALKELAAIKLDFSNELLYGRAGYLYSLLYVNKHITPPPIPDSLIRKTLDAILTSGQQKAVGAKFRCPLMYEWHDKYYLGAAHGLTGILYLLLQARHYLNDIELLSLIKPTIEYIVSLRFLSGNFPSSLGSDTDKYVQWCHGAPGLVYMFCLAYRVYGEPRYLQYALEAGEVVWERGLLHKGYSLCHGVSGNAYCFLELFQTTRDDKHLYRAVKFTEWCINCEKQYEKHPPDRPNSLFEGIAGPMYLLLDIQKPLEAKFPGFTL